MKSILLFISLLCAVVLPALGELTEQDLNKIRLIVKEEIKEELGTIKNDAKLMNAQMVTIQRNVASLKGRVDGIEKLITWLMALIVVVVGIPQIIIAWNSKRYNEQERKIEELTQGIEELKQHRIVNP